MSTWRRRLSEQKGKAAGKGGMRRSCVQNVRIRTLENPKQANFVAKAKNARPRNMMSESDVFAAARQGRWAPQR